MRNLLDRQRIKGVGRESGSGGLRTTKLYRPAEAQQRSEPSLRVGRGAWDEVLIVDARALLRPAEWVERKLVALLKSVYLPVSHVRTTALCNGRSRSSGSECPGQLPTTRHSSPGLGSHAGQ